MANFFIIAKTVRKFGDNTTFDRQVREFDTLEGINAQMLEDYGAYKGSSCYKIETAVSWLPQCTLTYFKAVSECGHSSVIHEAFLVKVG